MQANKKMELSDLRKHARSWVWNKRKARSYFGYGVIVFLISLILALIINPQEWDFSETIFELINSVVSTIVSIGFLGISLNYAKDQEEEAKTFWKKITFERTWKMIVASFLVGGIAIIGFLLLILPGIYLGVRLQFFSYAIIEKGLGPIEAIKWSWRITKGNFRRCVVFSLYFILRNIIGVLCLGIGLIWTIPMTMIAQAKFYLQLTNEREEEKETIG